DYEGVIWLGTAKGLLQLQGGSAIRPRTTDDRGTEEMVIYDVDGDETYIYMATQKSGVSRYNRATGNYEFFNKSEGLASLYTEGILWTDEKSMYVMTMMGLDKVSFVNDTNQVRHFWYSDGIGTENFSPAAAFYGKEGNLWFGSSDGVIIYSPVGERSRSKPPAVEIKRVLLFNNTTDWSIYADSILLNGLPHAPNLPYDKNSISFYLAGIQFGTGSNVTFEYQLAGLSDEWIELQGASSVSFSNLDPGEYTFNVRARNSNNLWSNTHPFHFTVTPPFWRTWWFFIIVLVVMTTLSMVMLTTYRSFRTEFIRTHRSFYDHHLTTSRLILLFGGSVYPLSGLLVRLFVPELETDGLVQLLIGATMLIFGLGTYIFELVRKYSTTIAYIGFSMVSVHVFYLTYINHLDPVMVVTLMVVMNGAGMLLDHIRAVVAYAIAILTATGLLMFLAEGQTGYNVWLLLLAVVISLIITFVTVVSRLNLFNRLIFADTTLNNSRSLVIAADATGNIVYVSRSVKAVLGYQPEEMIGDGWWKIRSADEEENKKMREKVLTFKGTTAPYMSVVTAKNGTKKWIQWVDTELPGNLRVGIGMDVSDRKEIEERYKHIVEAATDIIYTADYRGNFTFINDVVTKITGYKSEDLMGKHFTDAITPEWRDEVRNFYARQFRKKTISTYMEFPIIVVGGETRWLGQTVRIIFDEFRPTLVRGFQAIARDITDKKHYEEELEKLSLVASETINAVLICDPDGRIEWVNTGFSRITGYDIEEVKGKLPGDVLAGDRTDRSLISQVREVSAAAEGFRKEFLVYHKEGYEIWIDVANSPIVDEDGRMLKQIEIFTDITEKKRYEVQLNMYSARLETLNMAKHELL
ncbi:MAG TPA: PAS domain S-box protein, partial [Bacteroidia bacterium]|nr:PAS domain S-box protein [Bacteroidia bacterium]